MHHPLRIVRREVAFPPRFLFPGVHTVKIRLVTGPAIYSGTQVALDQLPQHYGNALEWKYLEGLPVKEIASRLKLSPKAAESLLTRAREAFRECFTSLTRTPLAELPRPLETSS